MSENDFLCLVDDVFNLPHGKVKFFCQRLKVDSVNQAAGDNGPIALGMNVLFNDLANMGVGVVHHLDFTRPVP